MAACHNEAADAIARLRLVLERPRDIDGEVVRRHPAADTGMGTRVSRMPTFCRQLRPASLAPRPGGSPLPGRTAKVREGSEGFQLFGGFVVITRPIAPLGFSNRGRQRCWIALGRL